MSIIEDNQRTELSEIGEFGLIEVLTKGIEIQNKSTIKGVGDDAAVLHYGNKETLVTKDLLIEGVHFDLTYVPLKHLGYKAAVVNISDIVAMNGKPNQLIIGIGASNRFSAEALSELYSGVYLACKNYGVDVVGGDTVSSNSGLVLSITCIGEASKSDIVYRNTANKGDLVFVSGNLGAAYMGLMILEREKQAFKVDPNMQPDLAGHDYILERQLKPEARDDVLRILKEAGVKPTSMIDISDGLASEILHITHQSKLGATIYEEKLPIDITTDLVSKEFAIDPTTAALNGGEDYELLFTVSQKDYEKLKEIKEITVIGHMTDEAAGVNLVSRSGTQVEITAQGWDAFLKKDQD
ncbi:MAG TPA: thiamine-phosphate kinase [Bacteroidales bacterium]|nr:thiamine-phosphate kinase [Bacteroidales bacterium]HPE56923.1 thiamine-phosphate kinase [Bacteroidales bacterium]HRX97022.1 thiamine-phosphate kinase [Bacteroidales bacterium]